MAYLGEWVWYTDEAGNKIVSQIVGFDYSGKAKLIVYPDNTGGQLKIRFSESDGYTYLEREETTNMPTPDAYNDGFEMGKALRDVFGNSNANAEAVLVLAQRFATMAGYAGLNDGFKFIKGFVGAFQSSPKQIVDGKPE